MRITRRGLLALLATAGVLGSRGAKASIARAVTLRDLVRQSQRTIVGTALAATAAWEPIGGRRRIVTTTRVRVDEALAGASGDSELLVKTLGGTVGDVGQIVHGEALLLIGEPAVLFLAPGHEGHLHVAAMAQGHYPLRADASGTRRLAKSPRLSELVGNDDAAVRKLGEKTLDEARAIIRKAWADAR